MNVYTERAHLIAVLTRIFPSKLQENFDGHERDRGFRYIVYIDSPYGQLSWHLADEDYKALFTGLEVVEGTSSIWDGHTTEEKYSRLDFIALDDIKNTFDLISYWDAKQQGFDPYYDMHNR